MSGIRHMNLINKISLYIKDKKLYLIITLTITYLIMKYFFSKINNINIIYFYSMINSIG